MTILLSDQKREGQTDEILYMADIHWIVHVIPLAMMTVGSIGVVLVLLSVITGLMGFLGYLGLILCVPFIKGLSLYIRNRRTKIYLTRYHLNLEGGLFGNEISKISLARVEGISLTQSMLGKYMNFGTLYIDTAGTKQWINIKDPKSFQQKLLSLTNKA